MLTSHLPIVMRIKSSLFFYQYWETPQCYWPFLIIASTFIINHPGKDYLSFSVSWLIESLTGNILPYSVKKILRWSISYLNPPNDLSKHHELLMECIRGQWRRGRRHPASGGQGRPIATRQERPGGGLRSHPWALARAAAGSRVTHAWGQGWQREQLKEVVAAQAQEA